MQRETSSSLTLIQEQNRFCRSKKDRRPGISRWIQWGTCNVSSTLAWQATKTSAIGCLRVTSNVMLRSSRINTQKYSGSLYLRMQSLACEELKVTYTLASQLNQWGSRLHSTRRHLYFRQLLAKRGTTSDNFNRSLGILLKNKFSSKELKTTKWVQSRNWKSFQKKEDLWLWASRWNQKALFRNRGPKSNKFSANQLVLSTEM